ncbi:MAG: Semialdehyde dehydrogenase - binding protein [Bacteroidetes bacterium]|jgi:uncharacterized protein YbjT (DUF2867 family)|nr:Semialdehyde dehydrogenase - binding protein [Bacteroidota bacterium]
MKKAIVIGSTGMVGRELIRLLINSPEYTQVVSLVRRAGNLTHAKLTEHVVDFNHPEQWQPLVKGDVLFSCMGTTLKKAGSKTNQYRVDFMYQYDAARAGARNGVRSYVLISSAGASVSSPFFYTQMKGRLDEAVLKLPYEAVNILRPAQLYGNRDENRVAERIALSLMFGLNKIGLFRKYRPIHAGKLAQAMINVAGDTSKVISSYADIFKLC